MTLAAAAVTALGLLLAIFVVFLVASPARADDTQTDTFPQKGIQSLEYSDGAWSITLVSADADEVKLVTPGPQEIACSEQEGIPKNGHPLCDTTTYTFTSQAQCVEVQVDWTANVHPSWDPRACQSDDVPADEPTDTPSGEPTTPATDTPTDTPAPPIITNVPVPPLPECGDGEEAQPAAGDGGPVYVCGPADLPNPGETSEPTPTATPVAVSDVDTTAPAELAPTGVDSARYLLLAGLLLVLGTLVLVSVAHGTAMKKRANR
jgi:hypothetical protein